MTARELDFTPRPVPTSPAIPTRLAHALCPRCESVLVQNYISEPPRCLTCGHEDYTYVVPQVTLERKRLGSGTVVRLRYHGFAPALQEVIMEVRSERRKSGYGIKVIPTCPLACGQDMEYSSYTGKKREKLYKCSRRHHVSILTSENGDWRGWH